MHPNVILYGSKYPLPQPVYLRAGMITMQYASGFLRYIKSGEIEILRIINHYIRDENWNTIPMTILTEDVKAAESSFTVSYTARCEQGDVLFDWKCDILGKEDSTITFEIEGTALRTFKRNRLGFTILHPLDTCLGNDCTLIRPDGSTSVVPFPVDIAPHQPFFDLAGMQWKPGSEIEATLHFDGDVFETEDQRNWIDASFKTYCTPLSKPFPVTVNAGDTVKQKVQLKVSDGNTMADKGESNLTFSLDNDITAAFPAVGLPLNSLPLTTTDWKRVADLKVDFLRLELRSDTPDISEMLETLPTTDIALELVLFFQREFDESFLAPLQRIGDRVKQVIALPAYTKSTEEQLIARVVPLLRRTFPNARIGGGTDEFFTELNRSRTPADSLDFLSFSVNPQVHAVDIATSTENLTALTHVVNSCRSFAEGKGVHVGPVTFKMRKNPNATSAKGSLKDGELPAGVDPRQLSLYGAGWTVASFKHLAESEVEALTYFETSGWKGLFSHPQQPWPADLLVPESCVYPVYLALREILSHKGSRIAKLVSSNPLIFDGLAFLDQDGNNTVMLSNFTQTVQVITLPEGMDVKRLGVLDANSIVEMMSDTQPLSAKPFQAKESIALPPFGVTILYPTY